MPRFADLDWLTVRCVSRSLRCNNDVWRANVPPIREALQVVAVKDLSPRFICERLARCSNSLRWCSFANNASRAFGGKASDFGCPQRIENRYYRCCSGSLWSRFRLRRHLAHFACDSVVPFVGSFGAGCGRRCDWRGPDRLAGCEQSCWAGAFDLRAGSSADHGPPAHHVPAAGCGWQGPESSKRCELRRVKGESQSGLAGSARLEERQESGDGEDVVGAAPPRN